MLLGEFSDLRMLELQDRFDLFVGKITRSAMSLMRWRIASLNSLRCAIASLFDRRTGCAARNSQSEAIAHWILLPARSFAMNSTAIAGGIPGGIPRHLSSAARCLSASDCSER
jgi:hypothetical protein